MGYTTNFNGKFTLDKPLTPEHKAYLVAFNETRRMRRNANILKEMEDPIRENVNLPFGEEGEFFVGGLGFMGQDNDNSIVNYNTPPKSQPGLWCQWVPNEDGTAIVWDEGEKFYQYIQWLHYIIDNFIEPWGYTLNGQVDWRGEDFYDIGSIVVSDNEIHATPSDI